MAADNDDQFEDDLESFDDVSEDGDMPAEDTLSDEDWDSYEEQPGESDVPDDLADDDQPEGESSPAKKKSSFNKILIGVAVLGGLGFVAMQMGGGAPAVPVEQQAAATSGVNPTVPAEPEEPAGGLLSSPQGMAQLQKDIAKRVPAPAPEPTPQPQLKEVNDTPVPPMPTAVSAPDAAPATEQLPVPGAVPEPPAPTPVVQADTHMPSAQDVMLKKAEPALPTPAIPDNSAALQEKQAQIDSLQTQIGTLESTVKTLNEKTTEDQATIAALEKKLAEKAAAPAPVIKADVRAADPVPTPAPKPEPKILGASEPEDAAPATSPKPEPVTTAKAEVAKPAAAVKVSSEWVLKGAQPGRAMVAKPGESEIKTVEVGDSLSGIGKITAIVYENGRWSVRGTKGRINQ